MAIRIVLKLALPYAYAEAPGSMSEENTIYTTTTHEGAGVNWTGFGKDTSFDWQRRNCWNSSYYLVDDCNPPSVLVVGHGIRIADGVLISLSSIL